MSDFTQILDRVQQGEAKAAEELLPLVYDQLRIVAAHKMAHEALGHTLQPTALVHEAWLRLVQGEGGSWQNRSHFFAAAAEAMRRILIDHARGKAAGKRGGGLERVDLEQIDVPAQADEDTLLRVSDAMEALAREDAVVAELVKLRFFAGLSVQEAALALGVSDRTARRYWRFGRVYLYEELCRRNG
jgi:RNA polymerase sigma factor (TIGR02999 family)